MAAHAQVMNVMAGAMQQHCTHAKTIGHGVGYVPLLNDCVAELNGTDLAQHTPARA